MDRDVRADLDKTGYQRDAVNLDVAMKDAMDNRYELRRLNTG